MKRIALFLATNIAILLVLSIAWAVLSTAFGFGPYLDEHGIDYGSLLLFSAVFGFGGALISLAMSKSIAKWTTRAQVITQPRNSTEAWLLSTVQRQAQQAGIRMPEVAIYHAAEPNAFATGARRNAALVAVSTGLLQNMREKEVEAVLAHEVSHVANGDMVTLTLIQGVLNTFVIFISRVIGMIVDRVVFRNERGHGPGFWITAIVAQLVLGILASIIVMWFSRHREYRADAGGAHLAGRENMIAALERLKGNATGQLPDSLQAFGISGGRNRRAAQFALLFSSHPPLDDRIRALREQRRG